MALPHVLVMRSRCRVPEVMGRGKEEKQVMMSKGGTEDTAGPAEAPVPRRRSKWDEVCTPNL